MYAGVASTATAVPTDETTETILGLRLNVWTSIVLFVLAVGGVMSAAGALMFVVNIWRTLDAGAWQDLRMEIPPLAPGDYHLKLDLVSEGIDWFESCGSEVTLKALHVV